MPEYMLRRVAEKGSDAKRSA